MRTECLFFGNQDTPDGTRNTVIRQWVRTEKRRDRTVRAIATRMPGSNQRVTSVSGLLAVLSHRASNRDSRRDDGQVLDDVLPFHRQRERESAGLKRSIG